MLGNKGGSQDTIPFVKENVGKKIEMFAVKGANGAELPGAIRRHSSALDLEAQPSSAMASTLG
ncbi:MULTISPECIES: hypothetical protein [Bradyrhizobium]|uniref:hypothetical protein n=1 Tax=Bradyrhizobium TaxID=374 RepID=UPI00155EC8F8|nr:MULTISPECIES: hypothetical protein [Bradyrhizobium]UUO32302.1 hypothetical protein DCG74_36690 [Bradyrhizobium sp. WBAH42]